MHPVSPPNSNTKIAAKDRVVTVHSFKYTKTCSGRQFVNSNKISSLRDSQLVALFALPLLSKRIPFSYANSKKLSEIPKMLMATK